MKFEELFGKPKESITIIGVSPLMPLLEDSARFFADMMTLSPNLKVTILCESDSELFNQSLCTDTDFSPDRASFAALTLHRDRIIGRTEKDGLKAALAVSLKNNKDRDSILDRFTVKQANLRLPVNMVAADDRLLISITTHRRPTIDSYFSVDQYPSLRDELRQFVDFYNDMDKGGKYLSKPGEELIQLYDRKGYPRGIFPRACFYTTGFERYSIWGFVFNRNGQLLLHQRGKKATDGRLLWDKSVGGHVDLRDSSTYITAQRELVEELFLPQAEYSKYMRADLGDIVHFGDWNTAKRPEHAAKEEILGLGQADWAMFRATDDDGSPLTVTRVSERRITVDKDKTKRGSGNKKETVTRKTVFRSDVYLFVAPPDYLRTEREMKELFRVAEEEGAANDHRLLTIEELRSWIAEEEKKGKAAEVFTDDILYINLEYRDLLERFSEFVKLLSE